MKARVSIIVLLLCTALTAASAQMPAPELRSWLLNLTGATGYNGLPSNVQKVQYSDPYVYITCSCIPGYDIGPWTGNPNKPANQNFAFKITRAAKQNTGAPVATPLGHIGIWSNGVSIFNAKDARSYNNLGVWNQNAIVVEGPGFDACLGHPQQNGEYHHHLNPACLYNWHDSTTHSPIIGYAFDGFPIYGAYGYVKADGSGGVMRMRSSFRLRNITDRTTLADGTKLQTAQYGPSVGGQYILGYYIEDFEYVPGLGDLDEHNGRFCVTPEYPKGTYAYFVTIDNLLRPAYPYTLGATYYGVVTPGNVGPGSGHVTPSEPVLTYSPTTGVNDQAADMHAAACPNPASTRVSVTLPGGTALWHLRLYDAAGQLVMEKQAVPGGDIVTFPIQELPAGLYYIRMQSGRTVHTATFTRVR